MGAVADEMRSLVQRPVAQLTCAISPIISPARAADEMLDSITRSLTDGLGVTDEWANQWTLRRRASMDVPELVGLHDVSWGDDIALTLELADLESRYCGKSVPGRRNRYSVLAGAALTCAFYSTEFEVDLCCNSSVLGDPCA